MSENGIVKDVIRYTLNSGLEVTLLPVRWYTHQAIIRRARELYPPPDPAAYEQLLEGVETADDVTLPATDNPAYATALAEVRSLQTSYILTQVAVFTLLPDGGREALIARYAEEIAAVRAFFGGEESDWELLVKHVLVGTMAEYNTLFELALGQAPLTEVEVADGLRIFRPALQPQAPGTLDTEKP